MARLHGIGEDDFRISYVDHKDNDLLPINNTDNYQVRLLAEALTISPVMRHHGCNFSCISGRFWLLLVLANINDLILLA